MRKDTRKAPVKKDADASPKRTVHPISPVRGMRDILPSEQPLWNMVRAKCIEIASAYGFERIDTPMVEETGLFVRGVGKYTDIVEKEMYSFETEGGSKLSLRPEGTASVMRSYISNGMVSLPQPVKLWYMGPMFRHDRPQHGRYRQFYQFGCEVIGEEDAVTDAQLALISYLILKELGLKPTIRINSIGTTETRTNYKNALVSYLRGHRSKLSEEDKKRLLRSPMRILDSKDPAIVEIKAEAPQIVDWLDERSKSHFMRVLEYLDETNVPYQLDPYLVRGLDYYADTVFEAYVEHEDEQGHAQLALGGGGRYDGLSEVLGGRETPGTGFSLGLDRIVAQLRESDIKPEKKQVDIFVAQLGEQGRKKALAVFEELRKAGIVSGEAFAKDSIRAQMEVANRQEAKFAIVIGQKEVLDGTAIIRDMESGTQEIIDVQKVIQEVHKKLGK